MKICFVGNLPSTFVKNDYETLSKHFDMDVAQPPKTKFGWQKINKNLLNLWKNTEGGIIKCIK